MEAEVYQKIKTHLGRYKKNNTKAILIVLLTLMTSFISIYLSLQSYFLIWLIGQFLFALNLIQWFIILHETGHNSFFEETKVNIFIGHLASFFTFVPFHAWKSIHHQHHVLTGWRDRDPTTKTTVVRSLSNLERNLMNICWKFWLPLFSFVYRFNSYWNYPFVKQHIHSEVQQKRILKNIIILGIVYILCIALNPVIMLKLFVLAILISFSLMDIILLSQHTHVPMMLTSEEQTPHDKIEYRDQDVYTRSLDVPKWIEKYLLFSFNQHELHHNFPSLPCYYLRPVQDQFKPNYQNTYSLWKWIMQVKSIRAEVFIFKHRKQTGHDI